MQKLQIILQCTDHTTCDITCLQKQKHKLYEVTIRTQLKEIPNKILHFIEIATNGLYQLLT